MCLRNGHRRGAVWQKIETMTTAIPSSPSPSTPLPSSPSPSAPLPSSPSPSAPPAPLGFVRDLIEMGQTGSDLGFHAFKLCTRYTFHLVRNCLSTPAGMADTVLGGNEMTNLLQNVHTTVDAAEVIAVTSILMAHTATTIGLSAADIGLEYGGIQRSENQFLQQLRTVIPSRYTEYTPFIQRIAEMLATFITPIRDIPPNRLRKILVSYALLQQANRPLLCPVSDSRRFSFTVPPDLVRCMGYAAAAYGHLTVNFLEFIPRGIYQSDILPLLVPGVSQKDVISEAEVVNPFCTGYLMVSDERDNHIVLSIRGSLNLNDLVTDLTCHPADCTSLFTHLSPPSPSGEEQLLSEQDLECLTHEGFLRAACYLDLLLRETVSQALRDRPNFTLLLCGHSLGAGVAALLTLIWSQIFLGVRCVCIGPPCLLNLAASRRVDSLITSVIVGDDFVTRLSLGSCYDLRDACLHLHSTHQSDERRLTSSPRSPRNVPEDLECDIEVGSASSPSPRVHDDTLTEMILSKTEYFHPSSLKLPLYQYSDLQGSVSFDSLMTTPHDPFPNPIELFEYSQFTSIEPTPQLARLEEQRQLTLKSMRYMMNDLQAVMKSFKLYPPGRIIHIVDREEWNVLASGSTMRISDDLILSDDQGTVAYLCDQEYFSTLQLSGNMFSSHLPTDYLKKLRNLFPLTT